MPLVTFSGFASLAVALYLVIRRGPFAAILDPLFIVAVYYFRFFGLAPEYTRWIFITDLAIVLAFCCFCSAFVFARRGTSDRAVRFFQRLWPHDHNRRGVVGPLSLPVKCLCIAFTLAFVVFNLWVSSVQFGGIQQALVRFYVARPVYDISPWLMRIQNNLWGVAAMVLFIVRFNCVVHRRDAILFWMTLLAYLIVALPAGSAGGLLQFPTVCVFADLVARVNLGEKPRVRSDILLGGGVILVGAMLLLVVRGQHFDSVRDVYGYLTSGEELAQTAVNLTGRAHAIVLEDAALCLETFGRSERFLWFHTPYSILVNPIPRELWADKPLGFGAVLTRIKLGDATAESTVSFAAGMAGEGYANGGVMGIVLLSLLFGYLCGKAAKYALVGFRLPNYPVLMVSIQLFAFSIHFVRGDMLSAWTQTVYPILIFLGVLVMCWPLRAGSPAPRAWRLDAS